MPASVHRELDPSSPVIFVGQDMAGRWLVQDAEKWIEGRFVSRAAALSFARAEGDIYHGTIRITGQPLSPAISFAQMADASRVLACAA